MEFERVWGQHVLLSTSGLTQGNSSVFPGHTSGKLLFGDVRQGLRPWHVDVERAGFKIAHGSFTQTHLISIGLKPEQTRAPVCCVPWKDATMGSTARGLP